MYICTVSILPKRGYELKSKDKEKKEEQILQLGKNIIRTVGVDEKHSVFLNPRRKR
jgi:hypothetical protein